MVEQAGKADTEAEGGADRSRPPDDSSAHWPAGRVALSEPTYDSHQCARRPDVAVILRNINTERNLELQIRARGSSGEITLA